MSTTVPEEGIVDVEKRKKSVEYTLGDPTIFPPEYLSWLKRFIEQSGIQLPASSIFGTFQAGGGSVRNLAPGIIIAFSGANPPPGSLAADGQSVSRTEYPKLFEIIGTTYGSVDANTFNVPDYRDRTLFGVGATLTAVTQNDGQPHGSRGPQHRHTVTDPGHGHPGASSVVNVGTNQGMGGGGGDGVMTPTPNAVTGISVGPAGKPLDAPAYHGVLYVITTG